MTYRPLSFVFLDTTAENHDVLKELATAAADPPVPSIYSSAAPIRSRSKPTALGPGANTDTKPLIYGLFQKGRVLAQDGSIEARQQLGRDDDDFQRIVGIAEAVEKLLLCVAVAPVWDVAFLAAVHRHDDV